MTAPPPGRHRGVGDGAAEEESEVGRHRRGARHQARRTRRVRPVHGVLLLAVAAVATGVGPLVPGLLAGGDRGGPRVASDGAPGATTSSAPPSPSSRPAEGRDPDDASGPDDVDAPDRAGPVAVPRSGSGTFRVAVAARGEEVAPELDVSGALTYTVEVEEGVPFGPRRTAGTVDRVLADDRGWEPTTGLELRRTTDAADFRVLIASPDTTDALCAPLETNGEVSCRNGDLVVLNALRWARGVPDYAGRLGQYRTYLVNHEVGHRLGFGHVECPAPGEPAPVMQQQTYGLDGCTRNAWPTTG